jgi:hypothetical protein
LSRAAPLRRGPVAAVSGSRNKAVIDIRVAGAKSREEAIMSWGYWGIVSGLLIMLTLFFFCLSLLANGREQFDGMEENTQAGSKGDGSSGKRHAA